MSRPPSLLLLSVSAALFLLLQTCPLAYASIESICAAAAGSDPRVHYGFCVGRLVLHRDSGEADTWRMAQIAAELTVNNSEVCIFAIKKMATKKPDPTLSRLLGGCAELHSGLVLAAAGAEDDIRARNYGGAKQRMERAGGLARQCEASFSRAGKASPVSEFNSEGVNLAVLCYAIINVGLHRDQPPTYRPPFSIELCLFPIAALGFRTKQQKPQNLGAKMWEWHRAA